MNYLWSGLILVSFLFALGADLNDVRVDRYRNGRPLPVEVRWPAPVGMPAPPGEPIVSISPAGWRGYFGRDPTPDEAALRFPATVTRDGQRLEVRLRGDALPAPLDAIRTFHDPDAKVLVGSGVDLTAAPVGSMQLTPVELHFAPVRFVRLRAINDAAVTFAQKAFEVALGLVGGLTLWLGLLKIAEDSGLVNVLVKVIRPIIGPLFPDVPKDSPALGLIALNVAANMLALGNAATPIGIKAMQELQKLNPTKDTATNAMVMLLAINTAGVTLLPSPSLVGIMGPRIGSVMGPIIATTGVSLAIAIVACKLLERWSKPVVAETAGT